MFDNTTRVLEIKDFEIGRELLEAKELLKEEPRAKIRDQLYLVSTNRRNYPLEYFSITGKHSGDLDLNYQNVETFVLQGQTRTSQHKAGFSAEFDLPHYGEYIVVESKTNNQLYIIHPKRGDLQIIQYAIHENSKEATRILKKATTVLLQDTPIGFCPVLAFLRDTKMLLLGDVFFGQTGFFKPINSLDIILQQAISE